MGFENHEAANIFPMDEEHVDTLAKDIKDNGQQVAIELLGGKIIDGRRRYAACKVAGVTPRTRNVLTADPIAYVLSLNLHRRHLTPSQLSMVGARAREVYDRQAKERQSATGTAPGRKKTVVENLPQAMDSGKARDAVGKAVGVSGKSIDYATKVINNAVPEVIKAVDEGRMAISTAAILSTEPPEVQVSEATKPKRNREYVTASKENSKPKETKSDKGKPKKEGELQGVGVYRANEAINCLIRIPENDALRERGFQIVTDWIRRNK